ncbi:MAG: beta-lactamase fold-like Zn-dependent hydrolase [Parcubacteria group bacterium Greene0714_21]|nr:MAG: beta-lactamase fold-like Zn-dependent hydrolase [Parcubacteria group bacterium Greene0416_39]TSC98198.1 MAG: beta-lactamase fold-like Zn-dependent hydrolase [Parcubacteria group bacterium Greene1014_47]TSD04067.1 MAG: beta-lactamase fold-like Zn-dependent hydrolase [Parcubacteria group bacterium Greene0714_21]
MQIFWKGQACFQILTSRGKDSQLSIVVDPYEESIGLKLPSLQADILLVTHNHFDHNNAKDVKGSPFVISNPGEYDVKGVFVQGIFSFHDDTQGKERGSNTIYRIEVEGMRICHLGDLGQKELTQEQLNQIGDVDILFVPVGGVYTIDGKEAARIVSQLEPKIVIPMHYALPKLKVKLEGVEEFLKPMGAKNAVAEPKLLVKERDLVNEERRVVVLTP